MAYWKSTDAQKRWNNNPKPRVLAVGGLALPTFLGGILALDVYIGYRDRVTRWRF